MGEAEEHIPVDFSPKSGRDRRLGCAGERSRRGICGCFGGGVKGLENLSGGCERNLEQENCNVVGY